DDETAQGAIVHVHDALPEDPSHVQPELIALRQVVVEHRGQEVVRGRDCVHVAREVEIDVLHRGNLGVTAARAPAFHADVACELGKTCWVVNYPDTDRAESSAKDFTCGPLTYDTHDGTDFGIRDLVAMATGVPVRA